MAIKHQLGVIREQVEAGEYTLKRFNYFLQKIYTAAKSPTQNALKQTSHENTKQHTDRMEKHLKAYLSLQSILRDLYTSEQQMVDTILHQMCGPELQLFKTMEKDRGNLEKKENQLMKDQKELYARVESSRQNCYKQWASLQKAHKARAIAVQSAPMRKDGQKELQKATTELQNQITKTQQLFDKHEQLVADSNAQVIRYWTEELPTMVSQYEGLERSRLEHLGTDVASLAYLLRRRAQAINAAAEALEASVADLSAEIEMRNFIAAAAQVVSEPPVELPKIRLELPCSSALLSRDSTELNILLAQDLETSIRSYEESLSQSSTTSPVPVVAAAAAAAASDSPASSYPEAAAAAVSAPATPETTVPVVAAPVAAAAAAQATPEQPAVEIFTIQHVGEPASKFELVAAVYAFTSEDPADLHFNEGDRIAVLRRPLNDDGSVSEWWVGALVVDGLITDQQGTFPSNYVQPISDQ